MKSSARAIIVWWRYLDKWIVPKHILLSSNLPSGWSLVKGGEIVRQVEERVKVDHVKKYRMVGVRWYGEGTFHRETVKGDSLSATYVTPLVPNSFIYNRLFAWKGSFAVVPEEHADCFVSNEFPQFVVNNDRILPRYLYLFFMCDATIKAVNKASIGSSAVSRNRFKEEDFLDFEIPLPPLPIQQAIVEKWRNTKEEIKAASKRIDTLEKNIAETALKNVGIELYPLEKRQKFFLINWNELERWGVEFNRWKWKLSELLLSHKHPMVVLSDEAFINPTDNVLLSDDELVSFIPMEAVSDKTGEIAAPQIRKCREVKNGYTRFSNDDVICAKITPCMQNGKCAVARNLKNDIGFGSTEFHVIRSKDKNRLIPDYIWTLLRLDHLRRAAQRYFIGSAGQQRVPTDFLANLQIPLPPVEIQKTIIDGVKKAYLEIAREREAAERKSLDIKTEIEALILGAKKIEALWL
jgi:type I restriction enzyme S subunit